MPTPPPLPPDSTTPLPRTRKGRPWLFLLLLVVGLSVAVIWSRRVAPVPDALSGVITLRTAMSDASAHGKPVVAVFTADWCPPCQHYKRTTLADAEVAARLKQQTIAIHVDVDQDKETLQLVAGMGVKVSGIPTTVVIKDDRVVAFQPGALSKSDLFALIDQAVR
ncbi:MAG: thioredoxin fold domain-containing protein [Phycisphaeraceae bacterium]|nr:thioredoxin fold domain-containing protein [Phycisphaeraceae bacterium]